MISTLNQPSNIISDVGLNTDSAETHKAADAAIRQQQINIELHRYEELAHQHEELRHRAQLWVDIHVTPFL